MPRTRFTPSLRCALALCATLAVVLPLPPTIAVRAATRVVTSLADNGAAGTLRREVADAAAGDTITFQPGLTGTITLNGTQITLDKSLTITGPGATSLTISGNNASRVFAVASNRTVTIGGLTITRGRAAGLGPGGGIYNDGGTLTVTNSVLSDNLAPIGGGIAVSSGSLTVAGSTLSNNNALVGGGIASGGTAVVTDSTFTNNDTTDFTNGRGAGIYTTGGTLRVTNSTLNGGSADRGGLVFNGVDTVATITGSTISGGTGFDGAGVYNDGTLTLVDSTVRNNFAYGGTGNGRSGGGIYNHGTLTLTRSTIRDNSASGFGPSNTGGGGGIFTDGTATITDSTIRDNSALASTGGGGGIRNGGANPGTLTLTRSTLSGNSATRGGGLMNGAGGATLANVTVSGNNSTSSDGGGIHNGAIPNTAANASLDLRNVTVTANTSSGKGGGVSMDGTSISLGNALLTGNTSDDDGTDYFGGVGTFGSAGYNFVTARSGNFVSQPGDILGNTAPRIGPLADNGGPTQTHALMRATMATVASPAINAGSNTVCAGAHVGNRDQRGVTRPQESACDIGAFESVPAPTLTITAYQTGVGGPLTLLGTNLSTITLVTVGGATVPALSVSPDGTGLTVRVPAGPVGTPLPLSVINDGGATATGTVTLFVPNAAPTPPRPAGMVVPAPPGTPPPRPTPGPMFGTAATPLPAPVRRFG